MRQLLISIFSIVTKNISQIEKKTNPKKSPAWKQIIIVFYKSWFEKHTSAFDFRFSIVTTKTSQIEKRKSTKKGSARTNRSSGFKKKNNEKKST